MSNLTQAWLEDQTSIRCLLVEITAKDITTNIETVFYLSNMGYTTSGTTAAVTYLPYLTGSLQTTEALNIDGGLSMSFGDIEVSNNNGELDAWLDSSKYVWANRSIQVYLGDPRWNAASLTEVHTVFEKIFDGIVADIDSSSRESINIKVRDKLDRLNYAISDNKLGTYGLWGSAGQSNQDSIRPLIFGEVNNITPLLISSYNKGGEYLFNDTNTITTVTAANSTTGELTCTSTLGMVPNKPITFSTISSGNTPGVMFGGLTNTVDSYYIRSITSPTTFTLQIGNGSTNVENFGTACIATDTSNYIYCADVSGFTVNQPIIFSGSGVPSPLVAGTVYYVQNIFTDLTAIKVTASVSGAIISLPASSNSNTWWITQNRGTLAPLVTGSGNILAETRAAAITAKCTSSTVSTFTCNSTKQFVVNKPVIFTAPVFGGVVEGVTYYIKTIPSTTTFTISDSLVSGIAGTALILTVGTGSMFTEVIHSGTESLIEIRDNGLPIYTNPSMYSGSGTRPSGALVNNATGKFTLVSPPAGAITASVQGVRRSINLKNSYAPTLGGTYINNANNIIALIATQYGNPSGRLTYQDLDLNNLNSYSATSIALAFTTVSSVVHTYVSATTESTLTLTGTNMSAYSAYIAVGDWVVVSGLSHPTLSATINSPAQLLTISDNSITLRLPNTLATITPITMLVASTVTLTKIDWASVGVAILDRVNVLSVLKDIAMSVGGQVFFSRSGKLQLLKLGTPTSDPVINITDNDILHHSLHISNKTEVVAATKIGYCLNYTPQTALSSILPNSASTMFNDQWYSTTVLDSAVQALYRLESTPTQLDTKLISGRDAVDLATRLNNYFKVPRTVYAFTGTAKLMYLKLGQSVTLTHNRFGLNTGKSGQVITLSPDWAAGTINVEVII